MTRHKHVVALCVAGLFLSGCAALPDIGVAGRDDTPDSHVAPATTPSSEPEASAEPSTDALPDLSDLVVTPSGVGPLRIGDQLPLESAPEVVEYDSGYCARTFAEGQERDEGRWRPNAAYERGENARPHFGVNVDGEDRLVRIDTESEDLRTDTGIGVGSSIESVETAYPDAEYVPFGDIAGTYLVRGDGGILAIEVSDPSQFGRADAPSPWEVVVMRVIAPSEPTGSVLYSEDIAGECN